MTVADNITEIIGGITTVVVGGAFLFRKLQTSWIKDGGDMAGAQANAKVIELMRVELERMAKVNSELADQVNKFQLENIALNARLQTVTLQMADLQHENAQLGAEIVDLRVAIKEFKAIFAQCKDCPRKLELMVDIDS